MKIPEVISKNGHEYILVKQCNEGLYLYKDLLYGYMETFTKFDLGLITERENMISVAKKRRKHKNIIDGGKYNMSRKFEYVKRVTSTGYEVKEPDFKLPERKTKKSAGYDFECIETITIPAYKLGDKPVLVPTGVKCKMQDDEFLMLVNRSSNPKKKNLVIPNSMGIIDADYYNNPDNDGEMMFAFYNLSNEDITIEKGYCIGQGIFQKYYITEDDNATGKRTGGFGSTSK